MKHLIDIANTHASAHNAQAVTDFDKLKESQRFDSECCDGRYAVINGVLFDLTQYDDRYVVLIAKCEYGFDATADISASLERESFIHAVVYGENDYNHADDLFIELIKAQL